MKRRIPLSLPGHDVPKLRHPDVMACLSGKFPFASKSGAKIVLKRMVSQAPRSSADRLSVYRCKDCGGFHIGHETQY